MVAPRLPRAQSVLALLATILVIGCVYPWPYRLWCAAGAALVVLALAYVRFRAHAAEARAKKEAPAFDVYARIEQIRAARAERFKGRRSRY